MQADHRATIEIPGSPPPVGPYAHAVRGHGLVFLSGQIPQDPESGDIVGSTAGEQAQQALSNLQRVVEGAGASLRDVVRVTVYLADMDSFAEVNAVYAKVFAVDPPARVAVEVARLPLDVLVEIDAIVALPSERSPGSAE